MQMTITVIALLFGTPTVFAVSIYFFKKKFKWIKSLIISFLTTILWLFLVLVTGFLTYNPYDKILEETLSDLEKRNTIDNNFLGYFMLGCTESDFENANKKFIKSCCDEFGRFNIDGIVYRSSFPDHCESKELEIDKDEVIDIFERLSLRHSCYFLDNELIFLSIRAYDSKNIAVFRQSNGYDLLHMDVRTSFEQFCDIHNSLSKKYGDPYITHIEDDQKYEEILKNYLVHAINDRFTINGPCICEWKDINLTIELSSAIHYYEYNHTLNVIPVINFYEHNKFNENSLRYKFGIEKETPEVKESEW